jgi:hypothetical protein
MKVKSRMAIGHNIDPDGLKFANELGGLVCPSLAVFRSDHHFKNYGKITLLMDKSSVDLKKDPLHNSDVFSTRFPTCHYTVDEKVLNNFASEVHSLVPDLPQIHSNVDYHDSSVVNKGFLNVYDKYLNDIKVLLAFVRQQGANPRIYKEKHTTGISFMENPDKPRSFARKLNSLDISKMTEEHPNYLEVSQLVYDQIEKGVLNLVKEKTNNPEEIKQDTRYFMETMEKRKFNDIDGKKGLSFSALHQIIRYAEKMHKSPDYVDTHKTMERLRKFVKTPKQKEVFKSWLQEKIGTAFHTPYMHVLTRGGNRKKLAFTAENVLKAMKHKGNGAERTIFMGAGMLRSLVSERITSFTELSKRMDSLASEKDMKGIQSEFNSRLSDIPDILAPHYLYRVDGMHYRDAVYEELFDFAKTGSIRSLESFEDIPSEKMDIIKTLLDDLKVAKTHYFEIKKQSIVGIDEFSVAIVPKGTEKKIIELLKSNDLKVDFYNPNIELDRIRAVNKHDDLLFGEGKEVTIDTPKIEKETALEM